MKAIDIHLNIFYVLSRFKEPLPKLLEKVSAEGKQFSWPGSRNINIRARYQA